MAAPTRNYELTKKITKLPSAACQAVPYFSTLSHLREKYIEDKVCFDFI
jgi:hypothetical protein